MTAKRKAIKAAERVRTLPPYLFARIDALRDDVASSGADVIDMGVGDPDMATLKPIVNEMGKAIKRKGNHQYPAYAGSMDFRISSAQ